MSGRVPTEKELKDFTEAFQLFDKDGDGRISAHELEKVMNVLGQYPTPGELQQMIDKIDIDRSGTIELDEFVILMGQSMREVSIDEELKTAFRVFDRDNNGFISRDELRRAMLDLGERLNNKQLNEMMEAADVNGDGKIDYREFVKMMTNDRK